MKKLCIYLFLVLFSLQNPSQADDIRDFQIEGISLGNSALDYIDEDKIVKKFWPGSKKYYSFDLDQNSKIKFETLTCFISLRFLNKKTIKNKAIIEIIINPTAPVSVKISK